MEGIFAKFQTSKGTILLELTYKQTPGTVGNFVALAEGNKKNDYKKRSTSSLKRFHTVRYQNRKN